MNTITSANSYALINGIATGPGLSNGRDAGKLARCDANPQNSQVTGTQPFQPMFQPFVYEAGLRRNSSTDNAEFGCEICFTLCNSKEALIWHLQTFHSPIVLPSSSSITGLQNAAVPPAHVAPVVAQNENKRIDPQSSEILRRRKTASRLNSFQYQCAECGKGFKKRFYLQRHVLTIHSNNRPVFACNYCGKAFKKKDNLKWHKATKHPDEFDAETRASSDEATSPFQPAPDLGQPGRYPCNSCRKIFRHEALWRFHKEMHLAKKSQGSTVKSNETLSQLSNSRQPSSIVNPSSSKTSSQKPTASSQVQRGPPSQQRHTGNDRQPTRIAQVTSQKGLPERACSTCGKTFKRLDHLKHHEATHTGMSPFSCSVCSRTFLSASTLYYHKKEHWLQEASSGGDSVPLLSCRVCSAVFKKEAALQKHISSKHASFVA